MAFVAAPRLRVGVFLAGPRAFSAASLARRSDFSAVFSLLACACSSCSSFARDKSVRRAWVVAVNRASARSRCTEFFVIGLSGQSAKFEYLAAFYDIRQQYVHKRMLAIERRTALILRDHDPLDGGKIALGERVVCRRKRLRCVPDSLRFAH